MQFSIFAFASLIALALASPIAMPAPAEGMPFDRDISPRTFLTQLLEIAVREAIAGDSAPAMTTSGGDVVPFVTADVTLPLAAAGQ
jgi:hypothetical protein